MEISRLHYLTQDLDAKSHAEQAEAACKGGVDWVQLRVKNQPYDAWLSIAREVKSVCDKYGAKLIVNDNAEIARAINADGVHLGKNDMSVAEARKILGADKIIGGTCNAFEDIVHNVNQGADYVGLGPFRFTETKKNLSAVLGAHGIGEIMSLCQSKQITITVIAIGGITEADLEVLNATGVHGVAVSSVINLAANATETAKVFMNYFKELSC